MTRYPNGIDDDATLPRVDNNLTQISGLAINSLRSAVFAIETTLGANPQASAASVAARLNKSLNPDGSIRGSALQSAGLASLPIDNNQVGVNAGIEESKLKLNFSTISLHTLILANIASIDSVSDLSEENRCNLRLHIQGAVHLLDGITLARHVASQIDLNAVPFDPRDPSYIWPGLRNRYGDLRPATQVASALLEINEDLIDHLNRILDAHPATAIVVDTSNFSEIPKTATNAQLAFQALDDQDRLTMGVHRANMHVNGIPRWTRSTTLEEDSLNFDGYNVLIVPPTTVQAYLYGPPPSANPVDSTTDGDDVIEFFPDNTGNEFDEKFTKVRSGDILYINYGNGLSARWIVESYRFVPGSQWFARINGVNLAEAEGIASIYRPKFDRNVYGVLAVAPANNDITTSVRASAIVGDPRGANVLGNGFEASELDAEHYNLWLVIYPTGNPEDLTIPLSAIDVTGNAGATPGAYTLDSVVRTTNNALRAKGFNYRFIAYERDGEFGLMLADSINSVSFSIISGEVVGGVLVESSFVKNVIGDASRGGNPSDGFDALGLGSAKGGFAGVPFGQPYSSALEAASFPTEVIPALKFRNYVVNGIRRDDFAPTPFAGYSEDDGYFAIEDGYWVGTLISRNAISGSATYEIPIDLRSVELRPGGTIVIQPTVPWTTGGLNNADYGRFILESVTYGDPCPPVVAKMTLTVLNADMDGVGSDPTLPVRIYWNESTVGFDALNMVDTASVIVYKRWFQIFIDDEGNTFSHERCRFPIQVEGAVLAEDLGTALWKTEDVSAKLRGFNSGAAQAKFFVRFQITAYDNATGEFSGWLGEPDGATGIKNTGQLVTSKKNTKTRFYDNSNVDFIELEYVDVAGSSPVTTGVPRFVDIEIFDSLSRDQEVFYIGSCELTDGNNRIDAAQDQRELGSVSEENFTDSAVAFVEAGDRVLHDNGIIRGFAAVQDLVEPTQVKADGGFAVVNGSVVAGNPSLVVIPEIVEASVGSGDIIDWAICVNQEGNFETHIITPTKQQFLASLPAGGPSFYVQSFTFSELVDTRRDLVPIAIVNVTIASTTINSVSDARRFVHTETFNIPFTFSTENGSSSFNSLEQLTTWLRIYTAGHREVKIVGKHLITDHLNWTNLPPFTIVGEGIGLYADSGSGYTVSDFSQLKFASGKILFLDGTSITARNLTFQFDVETPVAVDLGAGSENRPVLFEDVEFVFLGSNIGVNLASYSEFNRCRFDWSMSSPSGGGFIEALGGGCLYRRTDNQEVFDDASITNCRFISRVQDRYPFISLIQNSVGIATTTIFNSNIVITGNYFESKGVSVSRAAVALVRPLSNSARGGFRSCIISNNVAGQDQGIYITSTFQLNGNFGYLQAQQVTIDGNRCGRIGYYVRNLDQGHDLLRIANNFCTFIGNLDADGLASIDLSNNTSALGVVRIEGNACNWIQCFNGGGQAGDQIRSKVIITDNSLNAADPAYLINLNSATVTLLNDGISIQDTNDEIALLGTNAIVQNNQLSTGQGGLFFTDQYYKRGIFCSGAYIKNNIVDGFSAESGAVGIQNMAFGAVIGNEVRFGAPSNNETIGILSFVFVQISDNQLFRGTQDIEHYINIGGLCNVVDNAFDSPYINILNTDLNVIGIVGAPGGSIVERNINQTVNAFISGSLGTKSIGFVSGNVLFDTITGLPSDVQIELIPPTVSTSETLTFQVSSGSKRTFDWTIPLSEVIPYEVKLLSLQLTYTLSTILDAGEIKVTLAPAKGGTIIQSTLDLAGLPAGTATFDVPTPPASFVSSYHKLADPYVLKISAQTDHSIGMTLTLRNVSFTYRWTPV